MKNLNFKSVVITLSVLAVIVVSCKSREEKQLVNYWKLVTTKNPLRDSIRNAFVANIAELEANVDTAGNGKEVYLADLGTKKAVLHRIDSVFQLQCAASYIEIKGDGLYDCNLLDAKEAGNWSFDKKNSDFVTSPAGGKEEKLKVLKISSDSLVLGEDAKNCMVFAAAKGK